MIDRDLCCQGTQVETPKSVQNRPGLEELNYRVGTHRSFLSSMLARLSLLEYIEPSGQRRKPFQDYTTRDTQDPLVAFLDTWATLLDILTFYQERIANEGFLRTAKRQRSLVELSRLVGYEPRPGLSASVFLAFEIENPPPILRPENALVQGDEAAGRVTIPQGTLTKSTPRPGTDDKPQGFETSKDLLARADWNVLRPQRTKPQNLIDTAFGRPQVVLNGIALRIAANDVIAIQTQNRDKPVLRRITRVEEVNETQKTILHLVAEQFSVNELIEKLESTQKAIQDLFQVGSGIFTEPIAEQFTQSFQQFHQQLREGIGRENSVVEIDALLNSSNQNIPDPDGLSDLKLHEMNLRENYKKVIDNAQTSIFNKFKSTKQELNTEFQALKSLGEVIVSADSQTEPIQPSAPIPQALKIAQVFSIQGANDFEHTSDISLDLKPRKGGKVHSRSEDPLTSIHCKHSERDDKLNELIVQIDSMTDSETSVTITEKVDGDGNDFPFVDEFEQLVTFSPSHKPEWERLLQAVPPGTLFTKNMKFQVAIFDKSDDETDKEVALRWKDELIRKIFKDKDEISVADFLEELNSLKPLPIHSELRKWTFRLETKPTAGQPVSTTSKLTIVAPGSRTPLASFADLERDGAKFDTEVGVANPSSDFVSLMNESQLELRTSGEFRVGSRKKTTGPPNTGWFAQNFKINRFIESPATLSPDTDIQGAKLETKNIEDNSKVEVEVSQFTTLSEASTKTLSEILTIIAGHSETKDPNKNVLFILTVTPAGTSEEKTFVFSNSVFLDVTSLRSTSTLTRTLYTARIEHARGRLSSKFKIGTSETDSTTFTGETGFLSSQMNLISLREWMFQSSIHQESGGEDDFTLDVRQPGADTLIPARNGTIGQLFGDLSLADFFTIDSDDPERIVDAQIRIAADPKTSSATLKVGNINKRSIRISNTAIKKLASDLNAVTVTNYKNGRYAFQLEIKPAGDNSRFLSLATKTVNIKTDASPSTMSLNQHENFASSEASFSIDAGTPKAELKVCQVGGQTIKFTKNGGGKFTLSLRESSPVSGFGVAFVEIRLEDGGHVIDLQTLPVLIRPESYKWDSVFKDLTGIIKTNWGSDASVLRTIFSSIFSIQSVLKNDDGSTPPSVASLFEYIATQRKNVVDTLTPQNVAAENINSFKLSVAKELEKTWETSVPQQPVTPDPEGDSEIKAELLKFRDDYLISRYQNAIKFFQNEELDWSPSFKLTIQKLQDSFDVIEASSDGGYYDQIWQTAKKRHEESILRELRQIRLNFAREARVLIASEFSEEIANDQIEDLLSELCDFINQLSDESTISNGDVSINQIIQRLNTQFDGRSDKKETINAWNERKKDVLSDLIQRVTEKELRSASRRQGRDVVDSVEALLRNRGNLGESLRSLISTNLKSSDDGLINEPLPSIDPIEQASLEKQLRGFRIDGQETRPIVSIFRSKARQFGWNYPRSYRDVLEEFRQTGNSNIDAAVNLLRRHLPLKPEQVWKDELNEEAPNQVFLDGAFEEIQSLQPIAFILDSPDYESSSESERDPCSETAVEVQPDRSQPQAFVVQRASTHPRTAYGLSGETTEILLQGEDGWWDPVNDGLEQIRKTRILCNAEQLKPGEEILRDHVRGGHVTLDIVTLGLESTRPLIVEGIPVDAMGKGTKLREFVRIAQVYHDIDKELYGDRYRTTIVFDRDLQNEYYRDSVRIYANVVEATHGESVKQILGGGNGAEVFQTFELSRNQVSHVPFPSPNGYRRELEVRVNDVLWDAVDSLNQAQPDDKSYLVKVDHRQKMRMSFGDGNNGARLPSGQDNVRTRYRSGLGRSGNIEPEQIDQTVGAPLGVTGVVNPLSAQGGTDPDGPDLIRSRTPISVTAMDRLVSIQDFADFALTFAGINKATAVQIGTTVHLSVAGQQPQPLPSDGLLMKTLHQAITLASEPNQKFVLHPHLNALIHAHVRFGIVKGHNAEDVETSIRKNLESAFSFERTNFNEPVLRSHFIDVVQQTAGVLFVDIDSFARNEEGESSIETLRRFKDQRVPEIVPRGIRRNFDANSTAEFLGAELVFLDPAKPDTLVLEVVK